MRRATRWLSAIAFIVAPSLGPLQAQATRELFPNTKDLGRAAVEYQDDALHVAAGYYYSQRNHESRWLLIEVAVTSNAPMRIHRDDVTLVTPDGRVVPVAAQRAFSQDHRRTRRLIQNALVTRHPVENYLNVRFLQPFRWFVTSPAEGTVTDILDVNQHRGALGDLYFASPTGAWDEGTYSLVVQGQGAVRAIMPIDLE